MQLSDFVKAGSTTCESMTVLTLVSMLLYLSAQLLEDSLYMLVLNIDSNKRFSE